MVKYECINNFSIYSNIMFEHKGILLNEFKLSNVLVPYSFMEINVVKDLMVKIYDELPR